MVNPNNRLLDNGSVRCAQGWKKQVTTPKKTPVWSSFLDSQKIRQKKQANRATTLFARVPTPQNPENPVRLGNLFDRVPKSTFQHHRRLKSPTSDHRGAGSYISDNGGA